MLSILGELEEINSEISSFNNSQKDNLLDSECNSSPNGVKETNNYNITNSNLFKVNEQSAIMKQNVSGSDFPLVFQKKPSILNVKSINMKSCAYRLKSAKPASWNLRFQRPSCVNNVIKIRKYNILFFLTDENICLFGC